VLRAYIEESLAVSTETIAMAVDTSAFEDDLAMLTAYWLVKVTAKTNACEMHQLLQS